MEKFFSLPFSREVGIGKHVTCENEEQLLDFFLNSKDGAFMWRDNADFAVISNFYQVSIKIITVSSMGDMNPIVTCVEPDPALSHISDFVPGQVPDMMLFHTKNVHFDLLVPKNSKLAVDGGLDYQRKTNSIAKDSQIVIDEACEENHKNHDEEKDAMMRKMSELEDKMKQMEQRVKELEVKNEDLLKKLKHCNKSELVSESISTVRKHVESYEESEDSKCYSSGFKTVSERAVPDHMMRAHAKMLDDQKRCEFCGTKFWTSQHLKEHLTEQHSVDDIGCEKCDSKFISRSELNEHIKSHTQYECTDCQICFITERDLEDHVHEHSQIKCENCDVVFLTKILLETHIDEQHKENLFNCDKCEEVFVLKNSLEVHRKSVHMYNCEKYDKTFEGKVKFNKHTRTEHIVKNSWIGKAIHL